MTNFLSYFEAGRLGDFLKAKASDMRTWLRRKVQHWARGS
jgi:hypothetical protein